ncbi:MAG: hypothetical protein ACK42Z_06090 [Candidatus Kapaibacteriota bacterium]
MMAGEAKGIDYRPSNRFNFSIIFFFLVIIILLSLVILSFNWYKQRPVNNYRIVGLENYNKSLVDSLISLWLSSNSDFSKLKAKLEQVNFISSCKIYKQNNDTLIVEINERKPLVLLYERDHCIRLLTEDYKIIPQTHLNHSKVPLFKVDTINSQIFVKYSFVFDFLKALKGYSASLYSNISTIDKAGSSMCLTTRTTRTKLLLDERNCFAMLDALDALFKRKDFARFLKNEIDLRYDGLIVLR